MVVLDGNQLAERTCAAQQRSVTETGLWLSVSNIFAQNQTGQQPKVDISGVSFRTIADGQGVADLQVTGSMRVAILTLSQSQPVNEVWHLVWEGDKWKWCGSDSSATTGHFDRATDRARTVATAAIPQASSTPLPPTNRDPTLFALCYRIEDAGNGWNRARGSIGFKNLDRDYALIGPLPHPSKRYSVTDAVVETREGKPYPVKVYFTGLDYLEGEIDLSLVPPIPPGFSYVTGYSILRTGEGGWGNLYFEFKFAQAAHPTAIHFPSRPEWTLLLDDSAALCFDSLKLPIASPPPGVKTFADWKGGVIYEQPGKLKVTVEGCRRAVSTGHSDGELTLSMVNLDQFDEAKGAFTLPPIASVDESGDVWYQETLDVDFTLGPGQKQTTETWLFSDTVGGNWNRYVQYILVFRTDGQPDVYRVDDCK